MKYVAYYRVSTVKQGESGLGLEAQQAAVDAHVKSESGTLAESFTEVESGKRANRPQLALAIAAAKRLGATLVIAKLDRLARNVHFVSGLMESGIEFKACDMPNADKSMLQLMSVLAEHEARCVSERTKAALAAAKARGVKLGGPRADVAARMGNAANAEAAEAYAKDIRPLAERKRDDGKTLQEIADFLTGRGFKTRRGKQWSPTAVMRLLS